MREHISRIKETGTKVSKNEFDDLCRKGIIKNAKIDHFKDGHGHPYNPSRTIYGDIVKEDGATELVWTQSDDSI